MTPRNRPVPVVEMDGTSSSPFRVALVMTISAEANDAIASTRNAVPNKAFFITVSPPWVSFETREKP
jgi:hypothetical protein